MSGLRGGDTPPRPKSPEFRAKSGKGRPKGVKNKFTMAVKEMILEALDKAGGVEYLVEQSKENPVAFMGLVGKVLPMQLAGSGDDGEHVVVTRIELVGVRPGDSG
jgi:hypothetical protein